MDVHIDKAWTDHPSRRVNHLPGLRPLQTANGDNPVPDDAHVSSRRPAGSSPVNDVSPFDNCVELHVRPLQVVDETTASRFWIGQRQLHFCATLCREIDGTDDLDRLASFQAGDARLSVPGDGIDRVLDL